MMGVTEIYHSLANGGSQWPQPEQTLTHTHTHTHTHIFFFYLEFNMPSRVFNLQSQKGKKPYAKSLIGRKERQAIAGHDSNWNEQAEKCRHILCLFDSWLVGKVLFHQGH